jgi:hypothetical protein
MADVIDITKKLKEKKAAAEDYQYLQNGRLFQALHADLLQTINKHMRYGATHMNILGASAFILSSALAKVDPNLEHENFREILFSYISKTTDDELIKLWMDMEDETETTDER